LFIIIIINTCGPWPWALGAGVAMTRSQMPDV